MAELWEYMSLSFAQPLTMHRRQFPVGVLYPDMDALNQLGAEGWELASAIPNLSGIVFTDSPTAFATIRVNLIMKRRTQSEAGQAAQPMETSQMTQWEYAFLAISNDGKVRNGVQVLLNGEVVMRKDMSEERGPIPNAFLFAYFQELGSQGWEMVTAEGNRYVFKRRKQ